MCVCAVSFKSVVEHVIDGQEGAAELFVALANQVCSRPERPGRLVRLCSHWPRLAEALRPMHIDLKNVVAIVGHDFVHIKRNVQRSHWL